MNHTPGPWRVRCTATGSRFSKDWREIETDGNRPVVRADEYTRGDDVYSGVAITDPDARLIAAAPDMLIALQGLIDVLGPDGYHPAAGKQKADAARAAIAKAIGTPTT